MSSKNENPEGAAKTGLEIDRMAVKISHLDTLLGLTGEIIIAASNISILQRHLNTSQQAQVDKETMEMVKLATMTTSRISSDLHHLVMDIRMVPIKETFLRFRRLVRDTAKKRGRQVNFEIAGEDTLVDKTVAERLYEPLAHQIRNAIDHGIEDPLERQHVGKPPTGNLTLTAYKKEGFTYVAVADDGKGLDVPRIRQVAAEKGFLSPSSAAALSNNDAWNMIMLPGFSTAAQATEISGRGVGMDVVKSTVESMGGEVVIGSIPGKGTEFTYKIPQLSAVNITDAVIIRAGEQFFAVPVNNVVATQAVKRSEINTTMGRDENIIYLESILPLHDLLYLLTGNSSNDFQDKETFSVIIIEAKNGRIACRVSEFIRPQKLVLIPLPEGFKVTGISGTTIIGGSQLGMIIDPFQLVGKACGTGTEIINPSSLDLPATASLMDIPLPETPPAKEASVNAIATVADQGALPKVEIDGGLAEEFFIEIQNILKELNEDIFQLEKEPESPTRVNTIFRHFHSIKGNFMMTGLTGIGGFVHQVESVLDRIREKKLDVTQEVIDLLLDVIKLLEKGLVEIRAGHTYEVTDQDILKTLAGYQHTDTYVIERKASSDADDTFNMSPLGILLYNAKVRQKNVNIFETLIKLKESFQDPSLVSYLIIKRLTLLGYIIDTVPSLENIELGFSRDVLKVMFATTHSLEEVNRFFERQISKHFAIEMFENLILE
ncbi:MAG: Hpt domain-containing protein [Planctomycetota bacterium]|jgi:chemotaxis protein histidine kinase CheA|nr:Hpt domain-containing protein [Planctomycetota bacterium]